MTNPPRVCVDKVLPSARLAEAGELAVREAGRNLPDPVLLGDFVQEHALPADEYGTTAHDVRREALVSLTGKRWQTGRTIRWHFLDGPEWARDSVMKYASYWLNQANLRFVRTRDRGLSDVRVSFDPAHGGSWSYIATDALMIPKDEPTLALGWYLDTDEEDRRRVALHEAGHMLGFGHEQGHPEGDIPWDKERVYTEYQRTQGWNREEVDSQVFFRYSVGATNFSAYDPTSIMHYSLPAELLTDPSRAVGWNTVRSDLDRRYARIWYPRTASEAARFGLAQLAAAAKTFVQR